MNTADDPPPSEWPSGWRDAAECQSEDPEIFFPLPAQEATANLVMARRVCGRCTVRLPCLGYAVAAGREIGIWGGLTPVERRALTVRATGLD